HSHGALLLLLDLDPCSDSLVTRLPGACSVCCGLRTAANNQKSVGPVRVPCPDRLKRVAKVIARLTLSIDAPFVLATVVVATEVEIHFLQTLRRPPVLLLEFLRRLWPILVGVDGRGLVAAVHIETDRVQDFLIGHPRHAGRVAAGVFLLEFKLSPRLGAQR